MVTLADSLLSSSARKLPLRRRPDLTAKKQRYQGRTYWVVKEPIGLNYFRFQEEEFAILQMLDGSMSLDEIKEQFERQFPPEKITVGELQQFIGTLHRSGLIVAHVPGQGYQLKKRRDERKRKELLAALSNVLAIRFKGIDPERLLNWLYPYVRWLFTPAAVAGCLLLGLSALLLITVQFEVFQSKLPEFHQFFNLKNAIWLSVALAFSKVLHEFGHGLTCKHFGGECHEMGVMVLVLTPCLYCNVSDSWMLPNKWHRAMIGAAGMYVELMLASIATFIWWFTEPGLLNNLALSTMFVCSVSTLLFNGNPLLRYDGYYILSDIAEIPNLRQKATEILSRKLGEWCLGLESPEDPFLPERNQWFFALYTVAAALYRWVVVFSIMFFLYKVFEPYRLEIIGQAIMVMGLYGLVFQPIYKVGKFFWVPGRIDKVKSKPLIGTLCLLGAVVAAVMYVPLPYRPMCDFEIQLREPRPVYVDVPGTLEALFVKPGQPVRQSEPIASLTNLDVDLDIAQLRGTQARLIAEIENLKERRNKEQVAGLQLPNLEDQLRTVTEQLEQREIDRERLDLKAPAAGIVFPPPEIPAKKQDPTDDQLATWSGTPLRQRNLGAFLTPGVLFCQIGDPEKMEAILVIDQSEIDFIDVGQKVVLKLEELPGMTFESEITEISKSDLKVSPRHLSNKAGGELATKTDESGVERPMTISYQARAPLDDQEGLFRIGLRGKAKVHAGTMALGPRMYRLFKKTFNFNM